MARSFERGHRLRVARPTASAQVTAHVTAACLLVGLLVALPPLAVAQDTVTPAAQPTTTAVGDGTALAAGPLPVVQFPARARLQDLPGAAALHPKGQVTEITISLIPATVEGPTGSNGASLRFTNTLYRDDSTGDTFLTGPTIRARAGSEVQIHLKNELVQPEIPSEGGAGHQGHMAGGHMAGGHMAGFYGGLEGGRRVCRRSSVHGWAAGNLDTAVAQAGNRLHHWQ